MDDVFAEMKADAARAMATHQKNANTSKANHSKKGDSVEALMAQAEAKEALRRKKEKKEKKERKEKAAAASKVAMDIIQSQHKAKVAGEESGTETVEGVEVGEPMRERVETDSKTVMTKIARDVNSLSDESRSVRKSAINAIYAVLFKECSLSVEDYGEVFSDICKPIFKRFADPVEKIRETAFKITASFFDAASDFTLVLGYFVPALMARIPSGMAYDEEMKVFVTDLESHEAYRRGKAVDRADKANLGVATVVEASEELRRMGCEVLLKVVSKLCQDLDAASILHPYYHEIVVYTARQLRDPYGDVKIMACELLSVLMEVEEFNGGNKYFSVAMCRALYPVMRHRLARVRVSAVHALTITMAVEDRAKLKGAGTEALPDMVGFREENVLPVAAFYTADVQINYLAEVVGDSNHAVRQAVATLLRVFMTEMKDRYDHHTRLLPYLLDLLTDPTEVVRDSALKTLQLCGKQYEEEHTDEIIERRQYGVDGDRRINLQEPLPAPFTESGRPRLGVRLFVRGQIQRFLSALINEITNWIGTTRLKSANLLKMVVVLVEEHMTVEAHMVLPAFTKALGFARNDDDKDLEAVLLDVFTLTGRYLLPEVYVHYILPRISGDPKVVQFGVDAKTREEVLLILGCLLRGSQPREIAPHFGSIVASIVDPFAVDVTSHRLHTAAAELLHTLLLRMVGHGKAAIEGHFLATGRLTSLRGTVVVCFRWLWRGLSDLAARASSNLTVAHHGTHADAGADCTISSKSSSSSGGVLLTRLASGFVLLSQLDRDSDTASPSIEAGTGTCTGASVSLSLAYLRSMMRLHGRALVADLVGAPGSGTGTGDEDACVYLHGEDEELEQQQQRQLLALARSPFHVVQRDTSLLEACMTFAVELAAGKRGDVDAGTLHDIATFRFLSDYVAALVGPLRGMEKGEEAGDDAVHAAILAAVGTGAGTGTIATPLSEAECAQGRAVLQPKMKVLLQLLVLHSRWGYSGLSTGLVTHMHRLLSLLSSFAQEQRPGQDGALMPAGTVLEMGILRPLLSALLMITEPSSSSEGPGCTILLRAPAITRLAAVRLSVHLLSTSVSTFWESVPYAQRKAVPFPSSISSLTGREDMRQAISPSVAVLLLLLEDADEKVRLAAADGLAVAAPFVGMQGEGETVFAEASSGMTKIRISEVSDEDEEDEDDEGDDTINHGKGKDVIQDISTTELPPASMPRVLASSLRVLCGPQTDPLSLADSPLAQAVRTLCVLDPTYVQRSLQRLDSIQTSEDRDSRSVATSGGGVLLAGVLVPRLPPLTQGQRTYKEELGPLRELHKELLDHCALLSSLPG